MKRFKATILTVTVLGAMGAAAHAASVGLNIYNNTKANGSDLTASHVNVNVIDTGAGYSFTFTNDSTITSSITKIYFDHSFASVLAGAGTLTESAGVDYRPATIVSDPPFASDIGWTGSFAYYRAVGTDDPTKIANGILNGALESLTVSFTKVGGTVLDDVLDLLAGTGGIVAHMINIDNEGRTTNIDLTTLGSLDPTGGEDDPVVAIPTPASAAAGLALIGLLAARRRRRH
ncbi:MAG: hypothetical protein IT445_18575 [Phycisphaeraceae bacterium]|nr:hypothetical protein [Phycisphaeraceae bacterium]